MNNDQPKRPIRTDYYQGKQRVRTTRAAAARRAVPLAVMHMQANDYAATAVEVYDETTGKLFAVMRSSLVDGHLRLMVIYKRKDLS